MLQSRSMALSPPTQDLLLLAANGKKHVSISISSGTDGSTRVVATGINTTGLACFLGSDESLGDDPKPYTIVEHGTKPMVVLQGIEHAAVLDPDYNQDAYFAESQKCWEYVVAPFTGVDPEPLTPVSLKIIQISLWHVIPFPSWHVLAGQVKRMLGPCNHIQGCILLVRGCVRPIRAKVQDAAGWMRLWHVCSCHPDMTSQHAASLAHLASQLWPASGASND